MTQHKLSIALFKDLPIDVIAILYPDINTPELWDEFEKRLIALREREEIRDKIMAYQRQYDLPLHPNQSKEKLITLIRIYQKKNDIEEDD